MSFRDELWQDIQPIYAAILEHPFLAELAEGSLSRERFVFYMKQDSVYLQFFSRALAAVGARAPAMEERQFWFESSAGVIVVEHALHEGYFREFGVTDDAEQAPACFAYAHFLLAEVAMAPYPEAVAALLPCFWIYREVGLDVYKRYRGAENPYHRWIEQYAGEDFSRAVDKAIAIVEAAAERASEADRARMKQVFRTSSRLEWMFWDSAHRLEQWPPS